MAKKPDSNGQPQAPERITSISVAGFKSINKEQTIEVRPLTLLAGVNSSGKSSIMQPLLLLKQTLEAPYDPGALLLSGPNVRFSKVDQMLFRGTGSKQGNRYSVSFAVNHTPYMKITFKRGDQSPIDLEDISFKTENGNAVVLEPGAYIEKEQMQHVFSVFPGKDFVERVIADGAKVRTVRSRFWLDFLVIEPKRQSTIQRFGPALAVLPLHRGLHNLIHIPGLRGNPQRSYPVSAVRSRFPGTFENYVASLIRALAESHGEQLKQIGDDLQTLGLTWKVVASAVDDTQVEIRVGRMPKPTRGGASDLVNIADVGFGVSQTLPVVVALAVAQPGQLVYIEQPEIHLHPRAQIAMARLLVNAANRGVVVVAETHSSLLLLGVQSLVAEGTIKPEDVKLHWFARSNDDGSTRVTSAELDASGRFGDWPQDFDDVTLELQMRFMNAVEQRQVRG